MKLRKLTALAMTAALAVSSLAGCGSKDEVTSEQETKKTATSLSDAFEKAAALEKYTMDGSFTVTYEGEDFDIDDATKEFFGGDAVTIGSTWSGSVDRTNNALSADIGIKFGGSEAIDLLKYVYTDGDVYISTDTIVNGVEKIVTGIRDVTDDELEEFEAAFPDGDYLKISEEDIQEIIDSLSEALEDEMNVSGISYSAISDSLAEVSENSEYIDAVNYFAEIIVKGMKNGSETCFTNDGTTYKMTISKNNINDIIAGIAAQILENSEGIAEKINSIVGSEVLKSSDIEQAASLVSVYDVASLLDGYDFSFTLSASYVDDTFKTACTFAFSYGTNKIAASFETTAKKDDTVIITVPEDVVSDEDAQQCIDKIKNALESGVNSIDNSYDDYDFGDYDISEF